MSNNYIILFLINIALILPECTDIFSLNYDSTSSEDINCLYADYIIDSGNFYYCP